MPELKQAFERTGFSDVRTVLASGNVVFNAAAASNAKLERAAEAAMTKHLGRAFVTIVRPIDALRALLESNPYAAYRLKPGSKRIVTFLKTKAKQPAGLELPLARDGARILELRGAEIYSVYVPSPRGAAFMTLIEKTFGKDVTTRTWETVTKVVKSADELQPH
jgi:uncharacterized protein (DUF1697 family)